MRADRQRSERDEPTNTPHRAYSSSLLPRPLPSLPGRLLHNFTYCALLPLPSFFEASKTPGGCGKVLPNCQVPTGSDVGRKGRSSPRYLLVQNQASILYLFLLARISTEKMSSGHSTQYNRVEGQSPGHVSRSLRNVVLIRPLMRSHSSHSRRRKTPLMKG